MTNVDDWSNVNIDDDDDDGFSLNEFEQIQDNWKIDTDDELEEYHLDEKQEFDEFFEAEQQETQNFQKIMSFSEFQKYIAKKIVPHQSILITKKMLLNIDKSFSEVFGSSWIKLTRDDKRNKHKVFLKLYENVNIIFACIQREPDKYLRYVKEMIIDKYINKAKKKK